MHAMDTRAYTLPPALLPGDSHGSASSTSSLYFDWLSHRPSLPMHLGTCRHTAVVLLIFVWARPVWVQAFLQGCDEKGYFECGRGWGGKSHKVTINHKDYCCPQPDFREAIHKCCQAMAYEHDIYVSGIVRPDDTFTCARETERQVKQGRRNVQVRNPPCGSRTMFGTWSPSESCADVESCHEAKTCAECQERRRGGSTPKEAASGSRRETQRTRASPASQPCTLHQDLPQRASVVR